MNDYSPGSKLLLMVLCVSAVIASILSFNCASQDLAQKDEISAVMKKVEDVQNTVEGTGNIISKIDTTTQSTSTDIQKIAQQVQSGVGINAESIDEMSNSVKNTTNSTWLVIALACISAVLNVLLLGVIYWVVRKLFSLKTAVNYAIASEENSLTPDLWAKYKDFAQKG